MKHVSQRALISGAIELKDDPHGDPVNIVAKAVEDLTKTVDDRLKAVETKQAEEAKLKDRLDKIEAKVNRPGGTGGGDDADKKQQAETERKAWLTSIRRGNNALDDADKKVLTVANDVSAGYLAPAEVSNEFINDLIQYSPIRQYATVRQSLAPAVKYPGRATGTNAKWEGEIEEAEESTLTFRQIEIVSHRLTTFVELSNSLLMGSNGLAEAEVRNAFAEDFAIKEGRAFVNGSGIKEPEGIMTNPDVPIVPLGHASQILADGLLSLFYALPAPYRANAVWLLNSTTVPAIRKLKDAQGAYIWQPGLQAGQPASLLGRPIVEAPDMPDVAANAFPIAFGDLGTGYRIIDRQQLATLSDPYRKAEFAITRIYGTEWVGGGVVQPKAIVKAKVSVS